MEIDFGYFFHFQDNFENEHKKSKLDRFYKRLNIELTSYVDHLIKSSEGYNNQENKLRDELKLNYPNYVELDAEYHRLFKEYEKIHGGQAASRIAAHDSGVDQIDQELSYADEDIFNTFQYIRDTFFKSSLIYLYSVLESHLREICTILKDENAVLLDISDLSNRNYLETCFIYLSKVIGLNLENLDPYRNTFTDFQNLRNCLVHDFGIITPNKKNQIHKTLEAYKGIELIEGKIQIINYSILITFLRSIIMLFQDLYWVIDMKSNYLKLNANLNNGLQFITKGLSMQITSVEYAKGLTDAKFRNKIVHLDILNRKKEAIAQATISINTHKTKSSFRIRIAPPIYIPKTYSHKYTRLVKKLKEEPYVVISDIFQNFYLTQKLPRKVEITITLKS